MEVMWSPDDFTPILDLWVQQRNFLFLEKTYRNLPWTRKYINQKEKLERLGTDNFYKGYFSYLRSLVDCRKPQEIIELLDFTGDSECALHICEELTDQLQKTKNSNFFVLKYKVFGDILYKLFDHWKDNRIKPFVQRYWIICISMLYPKYITLKDKHGKRLGIRNALVIEYVSIKMFAEGRFDEIREISGGHYMPLLHTYKTRNPQDLIAADRFIQDKLAIDDKIYEQSL